MSIEICTYEVYGQHKSVTEIRVGVNVLSKNFVISIRSLFVFNDFT
jgi:hypothetical protein